MATHAGRGPLDGDWWPQSRDLGVELADHLPPTSGRIVRATYSPPDRDPAPRRVPVARGYVQVGSFPRDDTHLMLLKTAHGTELRVLVVPPSMSIDQGEEALLAAARPGYAHTPAHRLQTVKEQQVVDPGDHWSDDGGGEAIARPSASSTRRGR